jgi:Fe2+ transport system protein FeoA
LKSLEQSPRGETRTIVSIAGERRFRRRLLELGLVPGTKIAVVNVAPLGDPLEIEVRDTRFSIRRHEAAQIMVNE